MSDDLFTEDNDPFWTTPTAATQKRGKRERTRGGFLTVSLPWFDAAAAATGPHLVLALRIYRTWRMREKGTTAIAVTSGVLAGPGYSCWGKCRVVRRLQEAGLIEVLNPKPGQALRVRVIDGDLA
jgi:hypothetical protein